MEVYSEADKVFRFVRCGFHDALFLLFAAMGVVDEEIFLGRGNNGLDSEEDVGAAYRIDFIKNFSASPCLSDIISKDPHICSVKTC